MQSLSRPLKLGTRASPLALAQADEVRDKLCAHHGWTKDEIEIVTMTTTGDRFTDRPLSAIGGKGLFTKELEEGLYAGDIDFAVHSTKDVATILPDGLELSTILPREDVRDAFVSRKYRAISELPQGALVGTSSLRRKAQLLHLRPDLEIVEFRGSVQTRLEKLDAGVAEASFLAMAGIVRLGRQDLIDAGAVNPIEVEAMLPAAAQGAISIEIREADSALREFLSVLNCAKTSFSVRAERSFLRVLDGSCRTPISAYHDGKTLRGQVFSLDGARVIGGEWAGDDPFALGQMGADALLEQGAANVLGA